MGEEKDYAYLDAKKVIEIAIHLGLKFFLGGVALGATISWLVFR